MIRQDSVSLGFTITAIFLSLYWATGERNFIGVFPAILLVSAAAVNTYIGRRYPADNSMSGGDAAGILVYTLVAVAGMWFTGSFAQSYFGAAVALSGVDAMTFGVLMAVAEEQFFRGALLNFLAPRLGVLGAVAGSGAIFASYHFFVYAGNQSALLYVLAGGLLMAFITVKTGRISPAILAHVINNVLAAM